MHLLRATCAFLVTALALLSAGACAAQAAERAAAAPSLRIVKAPPAWTHSRQAVFRFRVAPASARTWCKLDNHAFRRCRAAVTYNALRAQRHVFVVRAKSGGRARTVRRAWTVRATADGVAPAGAPGAAVAPAPVTAPENAITPSSVPQAEDPPGLLFSDDFNGGVIDPAAWNIYDSPGHAGSGLRRPSAMALDGRGNLVLTADMRNGTIVSGGMAHRVNYTYGRFAFRVRAEPDPTATMNANVLTWPRDQWSPEFTENDIYETGWHANNNYRFNTFVHFGTQNWQHWYVHDSDPTQWHIVEMDWRPERLAIYRDGALAWETTDVPAIPDVPHHLCIQLDALTDRTLAQPVRMYVDWVRIFR